MKYGIMSFIVLGFVVLGILGGALKNNYLEFVSIFGIVVSFFIYIAWINKSVFFFLLTMLLVGAQIAGLFCGNNYITIGCYVAMLVCLFIAHRVLKKRSPIFKGNAEENALSVTICSVCGRKFTELNPDCGGGVCQICWAGSH